jgi:hypothetical protein
MEKKILDAIKPYHAKPDDIRPTIERYFEKHGFDLEEDNNAAELCDKVIDAITDLYHTAMYVRERVIVKKPYTKKDGEAIVAIGDWLHEFRNKH